MAHLERDRSLHSVICTLVEAKNAQDARDLEKRIVNSLAIR